VSRVKKNLADLRPFDESANNADSGASKNADGGAGAGPMGRETVQGGGGGPSGRQGPAASSGSASGGGVPRRRRTAGGCSFDSSFDKVVAAPSPFVNASDSEATVGRRSAASLTAAAHQPPLPLLPSPPAHHRLRSLPERLSAAATGCRPWGGQVGTAEAGRTGRGGCCPGWRSSQTWGSQGMQGMPALLPLLPLVLVLLPSLLLLLSSKVVVTHRAVRGPRARARAVGATWRGRATQIKRRQWSHSPCSHHLMHPKL
ncbi:hypothetical protein CLOP_g6236, partial [Closterium sp. NIES-67]